MKVSIYYLTLSILIFILIYNISIYNNKKIEKFTTQNTDNVETIINKFINKLNKKRYLINKKNNLKDILPECVNTNNVLITDYNNDINILSINNKEYGNIDKKVCQIDDASCFFNNNICDDATSFTNNNIIPVNWIIVPKLDVPSNSTTTYTISITPKNSLLFLKR